MMAQSRNRNRASQVTAPAVEPITVAEAKTHMRITHADEDTYIESLIAAARSYTENYLGMALVIQTWEMTLDQFPCGWLDMFPYSIHTPIEIPTPPLISVVSIKYDDIHGAEQTWSNTEYVVDTDRGEFGQVYPGEAYSYPEARVFYSAVRIQYTCGFETTDVSSPIDLAAGIPEDIKTALKMLVAHFHENREATSFGVNMSNLPLGYASLLAPYRVRNL